MSIDVVSGEIIDVSPDGTATITARIDMAAYVTKGFRRVSIYLEDDRVISDKQRKFCYALLSDIAKWQGDHEKAVEREVIKEYLKIKFIVDDLEPLARRMFSLKDAPMSIVNEFLKFLIDFILEKDVPTKKSLLAYVDGNNYEMYIYSCLIHKKCCISGKPADLHHVDRVGMGNNRDDIIHEGMEVLPLERILHKENHDIGDTEFYKKYHLDGGIIADKYLCGLYGFKTNKVKAGKEVIEE